MPDGEITPSVASRVFTLPTITDGHYPLNQVKFHTANGELRSILSIVVDSDGVRTLEYDGGVFDNLIGKIGASYRPLIKLTDTIN